MTLGAVIAVAVTLALLAYGLLAWEHIVRRRRDEEARAEHGGGGWGATSRARDARTMRAHGAPRVPPGALSWLAVRTTDASAVVRQLQLRTVLPADWRTGFDEVREGGVFVTPPIDGWVLAIGRVFAAHDVESRLVPLLERLAGAFARVSWFAADDDGERHGWALGEGRELQRGYAFDGELGATFWHGEVTAAEQALDCYRDDPRDGSDDDVKWWPDARLVHRLAAAWSLDPARWTEAPAAAPPGFVGRL